MKQRTAEQIPRRRGRRRGGDAIAATTETTTATGIAPRNEAEHKTRDSTGLDEKQQTHLQRGRTALASNSTRREVRVKVKIDVFDLFDRKVR
jgi:hypothetical protein